MCSPISEAAAPWPAKGLDTEKEMIKSTYNSEGPAAHAVGERKSLRLAGGVLHEKSLTYDCFGLISIRLYHAHVPNQSLLA
jgi:hypothetical protein